MVRMADQLSVCVCVDTVDSVVRVDVSLELFYQKKREQNRRCAAEFSRVNRNIARSEDSSFVFVWLCAAAGPGSGWIPKKRIKEYESFGVEARKKQIRPIIFLESARVLVMLGKWAMQK